MKRLGSLLVLLGGLHLFGGCASMTDAKMTKLRQRLDDLAQNESANQRRVEELNNRVFLLEDKVDTSRVAMQRKKKAPRLPVIRIKPDDDADDRRTDDRDDATDDRRAATPGSDGKATVAMDKVEFAGAAKKTHGPRPVLRLHGARGLSAAPLVSRSVPKRQRTRTLRLGGTDPRLVSSEKLPVVPMPKRSTVAAAMTMYTRAMDNYKAGRYGAAADAFKRFIGRHAKHAYADNALYWMGECFYDMKKYRLALRMFRRVVEAYPSGNKAPGALLKMGYAYLKLEEKGNARNVLKQVSEIFPESGVAKLAKHLLAKL